MIYRSTLILPAPAITTTPPTTTTTSSPSPPLPRSLGLAHSFLACFAESPSLRSPLRLYQIYVASPAHLACCPPFSLPASVLLPRAPSSGGRTARAQRVLVQGAQGAGHRWLWLQSGKNAALRVPQGKLNLGSRGKCYHARPTRAAPKLASGAARASDKVRASERPRGAGSGALRLAAPALDCIGAGRGVVLGLACILPDVGQDSLLERGRPAHQRGEEGEERQSSSPLSKGEGREQARAREAERVRDGGSGVSGCRQSNQSTRASPEGFERAPRPAWANRER